MNWDWKTTAAAAAVSAVLFAGMLGLYRHYSDPASGFDAKASAVAADLNGHTVGMPYGQAWPFDAAQSIEVVKVWGKKAGPAADTVVVFAHIRSAANVVPQDKDSKDKKEPPKKDAKTVRVKADGVVKLTYERAGGEWFLIQADNMTLRATMDEPQ